MSQATALNTTPLIESSCVPDIFCGSLAKMERIGPCVRLVFAVPQSVNCGQDEAPIERLVVAKLIVAADMLPAIAEMLIGDARPLSPEMRSVRAGLN